jgi:uncharacterized protein DUF2442
MARSVKLTQAAYDAAVRRAEEEDVQEPRASAASYDASKDAFVLTLRGNVALVIPRERIPGLAAHDADALGNVELEGGGEYIRWPALDVDHAVPFLVAGVLGIRTVRENARLAGSVRNAKKAAAVRANGRKGGRPKKTAA